jgi:hypothetical protein
MPHECERKTNYFMTIMTLILGIFIGFLLASSKKDMCLGMSKLKKFGKSSNSQADYGDIYDINNEVNQKTTEEPYNEPSFKE